MNLLNDWRMWRTDIDATDIFILFKCDKCLNYLDFQGALLIASPHHSDISSIQCDLHGDIGVVVSRE